MAPTQRFAQTQMDPRITTVFFDAVGTLICLSRTVGDHYREVALPFGIDPSADQLDHAFRTAWKNMPPRPNTAGPRPDDDKGWWCGLVRQVIDNTLPAAQRRFFPFDAYFEAVYAHFAEPGVWLAYPEAAEVLARLQSRGLKLGVISNFDRRLYSVLDRLDLRRFFAEVVISSEVGIDKPDPAIFRFALDALAVQSAEAVHVGDDPKCDWGATAAGLRVFELRRPEHTLRDLIPWLETASAPQKKLASADEMSYEISPQNAG